MVVGDGHGPLRGVGSIWPLGVWGRFGLSGVWGRFGLSGVDLPFDGISGLEWSRK